MSMQVENVDMTYKTYKIENSLASDQMKPSKPSRDSRKCVLTQAKQVPCEDELTLRAAEERVEIHLLRLHQKFFRNPNHLLQ